MCAKSPLLVVSDYEVRQVAWETLVSAAGSQRMQCNVEKPYYCLKKSY